jgi:hypothetical protein
VAKKSEQTASPARNFTLTTAERVQAIVQGVPAWARRLKRIEDLTGEIVQLHLAGSDHEAKKRLAEMVKLVDAHNSYYPMEANLPFDPDTSRIMDGGEPWRPMPRPTIQSLVDAQREDDDDVPESLEWKDLDGVLSVAFDEGGSKVTLRLDQEAFALLRDGEIVRHVPLWNVEELAADPLRLITIDTETIELPSPPKLDQTIAIELSTRLRSLRSTGSAYRGATHS